MHDYSVVGASAIGCLAAKHLARKGFKVRAFEEDAGPGKGGKCTGIVSLRGLKQIGVQYEDCVLNTIDEALIHSPNHSFNVRRKSVAKVIDRQKFDEQCFLEAQGEGAEFLFKKRVKRLPKGPVIGADGASSTVARLAGFPPIKEFVSCFERECELENDGRVHVYLDAELFPGFFGWVVPVNAKTARVGFGSTDFSRVKASKKRFLEKTGAGTAKREFYALIPRTSRTKTREGRATLVGDAAGQTKATTGGGLVFGSKCARLVERSDYEAAWRRECSALKWHARARRFLDARDNKGLDALAGAGGLLGAGRFLSAFGDMDEILRNK
jgi:digeranylgeranylglycerophospholipid reductase